jgi:hypothetical protein
MPPRKLTLSRAFYPILKGGASAVSSAERLRAVERVTHSDCSFPLFVIPGLTRNPVFLSLKDQKIAFLEERVSNLEKENDLLKEYE